MFCPGSFTNKHSREARTQVLNGSALALQAAFADINIHKSRSVYYWLCFKSVELRQLNEGLPLS
jgi:hypothetical protein